MSYQICISIKDSSISDFQQFRRRAGMSGVSTAIMKLIRDDNARFNQIRNEAQAE